jgi:pyrimidine-nucleoside phosphorylase
MKKRNGATLSETEISGLVEGYVNGDVPDYQVSAFLMAVYFQGLSFEETGFLTRAMIESGDVIDLGGLDGPLVDKHSTGGVGDKVSLVLAPLAAACGLQVPMMSGRALGHTGGTLDKLESIPGYSTMLSEEDFVNVIARNGYAMIGQSECVVPADRLMYALRDVTATVESIPLITASILSKKFAEGAEGLVFDVKAGRGAFMKTLDEARGLADSLVKTGRALGRRVSVVITSMEEPLGEAVGNFLEVREAIAALQDRGPADLRIVTLRLAAHMLLLGGLATDIDSGERKAAAVLADGSAWKRFVGNVRDQGGDTRVVEDPDRAVSAASQRPVPSPSAGYVTSLDAYAVGLAAVHLGAGRARQDDGVRPEVGVMLHKKCGDRVEAGEPLCTVHAPDEESHHEAARRLLDAYTLRSKPSGTPGLVLAEIGS